MKPLIIGTGFLGEQLYYDLKKSVDKIVVTHRTNRKFDFSYKFDFFTDSIKDTFFLRLSKIIAANVSRLSVCSDANELRTVC